MFPNFGDYNFYIYAAYGVALAGWTVLVVQAYIRWRRAKKL